MTAPDAAASPTLRRVLRGGLCSGCGGCVAAAPGKVSMERSATGFARPRQAQPLAAREEALIARICPGSSVRSPRAGDLFDPLWGPYVAVRTGWAADPELRFEASSGGALSAILNHLLDSGAVDAVVENAADPEEPVANATVIVEDGAGVADGAGSRYAPSAPLAIVAELLDDARRFAFVGKPCDVAALRSLAEADPRVDQRFPVMISFFCAGVPSLEGGARIVAALGADPADVVSFRYRGRGWPGRAAAELKSGEAKSMTYEESWGGVLSGLVQLRCRICPDGTGHFADIVCADAWETDAQGYPVFEERDGISLIMSRTKKGEAIVAAAMASGAIEATDFDIGELADVQPGQVSKRRFALPRLLALRTAGRPTPRYEGFPLARNAAGAPVVELVRNYFGALLRALRGRLRY